MVSEFSTKGGLNEQVFAEFKENGGTKALTLALDSVLKRIEQK
jgi:pyrroline-5-carboxylate reductase